MMNVFPIAKGEVCSRLYLTILLLIVGSFFAVFLGTQLNPDGILYFSYLRSAFFDRDILLVNEFNELQLLPLSRHLSATGLEGNPVAIGTSILMSPFYATAFLIDRLCGLMGIDIGDHGYWGIYLYVFPFGSLFYGCLTGWMILGILKKQYQLSHAALSLMHIVLGTPFLFYLAVHYHVSHLCSAFSVTLFLYLFETVRNDASLADRYSTHFFLGALSGVAILVRTQNGLFWIIPFCFLLSRLWHTGNFGRVMIQGISFLAGAIIAVSPQLTVWKILHGSWVHAPEAANVNLFQPRLLEVLTSSYHGLFFWSPILIISIIGLCFLVRMDADRGIPLLLAVLLQLIINGSMRMWWEGASFGLRLFMNCTPIFCIGLSVAYTQVKASWIRILGSLLVFWTFLLYLNVVTARIDLNRFYPAMELIRLQARQFTGLLFLQKPDAYLAFLKSLGGSAILVAGVGITIMAIMRLRKTLIAIIDHRQLSTFGVMGVLIAGMGLSGLIYFLGINSQHHKRFWQDDLKRIESGMNSYSLFYIDYWFYVMHAEYLAALGRESEAIHEYWKALQIYPTPGLYRNLTYLLAKRGRHKEAGDAIRQALARWPDDPHLIKQEKWLHAIRPVP